MKLHTRGWFYKVNMIYAFLIKIHVISNVTVAQFVLYDLASFISYWLLLSCDTRMQNKLSENSFEIV